VTIFLVLIFDINLFGVKGYGEAEFWFALVKVVAIVGFMYVLPLFPLPFFSRKSRRTDGKQHLRHHPRLRRRF
jgi:amino acid permease